MLKYFGIYVFSIYYIAKKLPNESCKKFLHLLRRKENLANKRFYEE